MATESVSVGQMVTLIDEDGTIFTTTLTEDEARHTEIDPNMAHGLLVRARSELNTIEKQEMYNNMSTALEEELPPDRNQMWSHQTILLLLEGYQKKRKQFQGRKKKNKIWDEVAALIRKKYDDAYFTGKACDRKFRNMMCTYRSIKSGKNRTGKTSKTWRYLDIFERMLQNWESTKRKSSRSSPASLLMVGSKASNHSPNESDFSLEFDYGRTSDLSSESSYGGYRRRSDSYSSSPAKRIRRASDTCTCSADLIDKILVQQTEIMARFETMHAENLQLAKERNELLRILNDKLQRAVGVGVDTASSSSPLPTLLLDTVPPTVAS